MSEVRDALLGEEWYLVRELRAYRRNTPAMRDVAMSSDSIQITQVESISVMGSLPTTVRCNEQRN